MELDAAAMAMGRRRLLNMWNYEKRLEYPVNIKTPNAKIAQIILSQYGGPDGELGASLRYLSQRYSMPYPELKGLLTDIGTSVSLGARFLPFYGRYLFFSRKNIIIV